MSETYKEYPIEPLAGATVSGNMTGAELIDTRFDTVETALNDLSSRIYSLNTRSAIVRHDVPLDDGTVSGERVHVGSLVYYNTAMAKYCNAKAVTLAESTAGGMTIEAPSARVEGIILATNDGSPLTGTMLCGGYWEDTTVANNCLGTGAGPGVYYLSPTVAGTATLDTYGHLRQPVLSYYGYGKFSMTLFYMAHDNHFHSTSKLDDDWGPANVNINGSTSNYVYNGTLDAGLGEIGDTTAIFQDGKLQAPGDPNNHFRIYNNRLYYMDAEEPTGTIVLFNHYPFAYGSSVVRTITSDNSALSVKNENGQVTLTANDFTQGATNKSALAIYGISGKELNYTPVVTDVQAGPGITVSRATDGTAYISAANTIGGLMDAFSINHNGTTLITDGNNLQFITFPAGRASQFVMYLPVQGLSTPCTVSVWGIKAGATSAMLKVNASFIPDPTLGQTSEIVMGGGTGTLVYSADQAATTNTLTYEEDTVAGCTASGSGLLVATVAVDTNTGSQVKLLRTGFKLAAIASNIGVSGDIVDSNAITQTLEVAPSAEIKAGDAVLLLDSGKLAVCTNIKNGAAHNANRCVGIAVTGGTGGDQLQYMISGTMTLPVAGGAAGQSLYIDRDGSLRPVTDTDDFMQEVDFLQKVGTILTGSKIQVTIEPAVRGTN